jgi:prepilin-type N-terminal cleavage/methylation domain-containing protein/prepilin-type processing-associated H-X9-DG protein
MSAQHRPRRGFTLVELLVVVGIIGLLVSILLPALGKARDSANTLACLSNCRQLGNAFVMYSMDHKGWLPYPTTSQGEQMLWFRCVDPYLGAKIDQRRSNGTTGLNAATRSFAAYKQDPIWQTFSDDPHTMTSQGTIKEASRTLKMNTHLRRGPNVAKITDVKESSKFVLIGDSTAYDIIPAANSGDLSHFSMQISEIDNTNDAYPYMRHRKGTACNIAFVDGHAETMVLELAPPGATPKGSGTLSFGGVTPVITPPNYRIWYTEYVDGGGAPQWPLPNLFNKSLPAGWGRNPKMPMHWSQPPTLWR